MSADTEGDSRIWRKVQPLLNAMEHLTEELAQLELCYDELKATHARWQGALNRSSHDLTVCRHCGLPVFALPDGMPMCEDCAENIGEGGI